MNVHQFILKWDRAALTERSASQQHFLDLCEVVGHPKPAEMDPEGESFTFEKGAVFHDPEKLKPGTTREAITQDAARRIGDIAQTMRARGLDPHEVAQFLDRIVFALFAEDVNLLPDKIFTRIIRHSYKDFYPNPELFTRFVGELFGVMARGGFWGADEIRHFNGNLFTNGPVLTLTKDELTEIRQAAKLDWSAIDPSIFGTLFERGLDPDKRSQLGAHYTSREDIETLVEPVVMQPLRREWDDVRRVVENLLATGQKDPTEKDWAKVPPEGLSGPALRKARVEADLILRRFWERLGKVKVLDPACGSGNFLYITLQKLKDLEKELILFAMERGFPGFPPHVGPWQLYGIEVNPYAYELAQMSVWIGYLQWLRTNGFGEPEDPILRPMDSFDCKDAILDLADPDNPKEPAWPKVDFIVGNPPFLGGKKLRSILGDVYVEKLFQRWQGQVPAEADLCCYWFEKARTEIQRERCSRAGLLATQGIRGGANREVLEQIKQSGGIFFAESDREWVLDGANVHVSMVGFDDGSERRRVLDGVQVEEIYSPLTATINHSGAAKLRANLGLAFMGATPSGPFVIRDEEALSLLQEPNVRGRPPSDVLRPWVNSDDLTRRRPRNAWVLDLNEFEDVETASLYEGAFALVEDRVQRARAEYRTGGQRFWRFERPRPEMRRAIGKLSRFLVTPTVSKHRLFLWLESPTLPDHQLIVIARSDDYFLGILQSHLHSAWGLRLGTRLETRPRYTPTTSFETFPLPQSQAEHQADIASFARELDARRNRWLNPPEWTREEVLEFPGSINGPWARYVHDPDERGIGTVRYPRLVPKDEEAAEKLKARTLTNLYNQRPTWLDLAHRKLDEAVFAAYGWDPGISDEEILERLLALNLERAGA